MAVAKRMKKIRVTSGEQLLEVLEKPSYPDPIVAYSVNEQRRHRPRRRKENDLDVFLVNASTEPSPYYPVYVFTIPEESQHICEVNAEILSNMKDDEELATLFLDVFPPDPRINLDDPGVQGVTAALAWYFANLSFNEQEDEEEKSKMIEVTLVYDGEELTTIGAKVYEE